MLLDGTGRHSPCGSSVPKTLGSVASSDAKAAFPVQLSSVPVWWEVQPANVAGQCR